MSDKEELRYKDERSGILVNGVGRSGNRALLYSMGLEEDDFRKPMIGIANSFSELVPGHIHLRELARDVSDGILEGGGIPREFDTIALCDGLCQGHCGMRYSLPSREIIADSVEAVVEGNQLDGVVLIASCDKIVPGMMMAAARLSIPAIVVTGGPMIAGKCNGRTNICLSNLREFVGEYQVGKMTYDELRKMEMASLPTVGSCSMFGTANTMSALAEVLGLTLPFMGTCPAVASEKRRLARASGKRIVKMVKEGLSTDKILTKEAFLNGIKAVMALGASTNSVLHLMAISHEAHADITLDDFDRISRQVPYLCNLRPSGAYAVDVLHDNGGIPAVLKAIQDKIDDSQITVTGHSIKEVLEAQPLVENDVIYPRSAPKTSRAALLSSMATWLLMALSSRPVVSNRPCTSSRARPASLTAWKTPLRPLKTAKSMLAKSLSCAMKARKAALACGKCSLSRPFLWDAAWMKARPLLQTGVFRVDPWALHWSYFSGSGRWRSHWPY